jgi:hypothetical protein
MVAALPTDGAEHSWRTASALQLVEALYPEPQRESWSALTFAYIDRRQITPPDLASFFQNEVTGDELPRTRLMGTVDYIQRRYELTAGNWTDQGHAVELLNVDLFFTRDGTFAKVLGDLADVLSVRARVVHVDGRGPVLNQLEAAYA